MQLLVLPQGQNDHKSKHFESLQDIEAATLAKLKTLTREDFQSCFEKWQERWVKSVPSKREYFEGDEWQDVFYCNNLEFKFFNHMP